MANIQKHVTTPGPPLQRDPAPAVVDLGLPPLVLGLADKRALDSDIEGAKAANLARAMQGGFTVLDGFVVTIEGTRVFSTQRARQIGRDLEKLLKKRWAALSAEGTRPLVVRSSSSAEDGHDSAMAGMFTSVLDVESWADFRRAMQTVVESARIIDLVEERETFAPMAVLVQPQLAPEWGGVLFGVDPVTGRADHLVVAAVDGRPDALVSGTVEGHRYVLTHSGRIVERSPGGTLPKTVLKRLTKLAERAAGHFGGAQDVEWALVGDELIMMQSRPVTAVADTRSATGPVLGPGPVAETFPQPLTALESDLWVEPLRVAIAEVLALTGAASKKTLTRSPVVTTVGGRVVADLRLLGAFPGKKTFFETIDPRPPSRRLAAAWRTGRLRAALPSIAAAMVEKVDDDLADVPDLDALDDVAMVELLRRCRQALVSLHAHEVMFGLLANEQYTVTAASVGLRHLAAARAEGVSDADVVATRPEVLALVPPSIFGDGALPATDSLIPRSQDDGLLPQREALRLRARWVQELAGRAARALGARLYELGRVDDPAAISTLTFEELEVAVSLGAMPADVAERRHEPGPSLPAAFRLTDDGAVVVYRPRKKKAAGTGGTGASAGHAEGIVHDGEGLPEQGEVLVVATLDPDLATLLPRLGALVSETGSVLSHLAIMAREYGVPTVVGVPDALTRFPAGSRISVDGTSGEVKLVGGDAS